MKETSEALERLRYLTSADGLSGDDLIFVRCREENEYRKKLEALLADVRSRSVVPIAVPVVRLALLENLGVLYFESDRAYWSREFYFEARIPKCQRCFGGWQNVELFSMRTSEKPNYYCISRTGGCSMKCKFCCLCRPPLYFHTTVGWICGSPPKICLKFRQRR